MTGFGHRVYRAEDPRARATCATVCASWARKWARPNGMKSLQAVVEAMQPYARHGLNVNVDFYSGVIYQLHGIPMDLYVPDLRHRGACPAGVIQCIEQQRQNILIRPPHAL